VQTAEVKYELPLAPIGGAHGGRGDVDDAGRSAMAKPKMGGGTPITVETVEFCKAGGFICLEGYFSNQTSSDGTFKPDKAKFGLKLNNSALATKIANDGQTANVGSLSTLRVAVVVQLTWNSKRSGDGSGSDADVTDNTVANNVALGSDANSAVPADIVIGNGDKDRIFFNFERSATCTKSSVACASVPIVNSLVLDDDVAIPNGAKFAKSKRIIFSFAADMSTYDQVLWDPALNANSDELITSSGASMAAVATLAISLLATLLGLLV